MLENEKNDPDPDPDSDQSKNKNKQTIVACSDAYPSSTFHELQIFSRPKPV